MQKTYVFFTANISNIGGAQLYIKNKSIYLEENGWIVFIFSGNNKNLMINYFTDNDNNYLIPEFKFYPYLFSDKIQQSTISNIEGALLSTVNKGSTDVMIIESHTDRTALWGELLAKKINCKNFVFLLNENFRKLPNFLLNYFEFKHGRKELAGINPKSLGLLFKEYKTLNESECYSLKAINAVNNVADISDPDIDKLIKLDINIGCISRFEKTYMKPMVDEIVLFASHHEDLSIQVVLIGGSTVKGTERDIEVKFSKAKNVKLTMTGPKNPIPRRLFQIIDIFISTAGSARVCAQEGSLTMTLDRESHRPIGLLGIDTNATLFSDHTTNRSVSELLEDVLINKQLHKGEFQVNSDLDSLNVQNEFSNHLNFIQLSNIEKEYFDVAFSKLPFREQVIRFLIKIFGYKMVGRLIRLYKKVGISI